MTRMTVRKDYSPYEAFHRELFAVLRKAGWRPDRYVAFPDAAPDADGEPSGLVVLEDEAEAFLHAFHGLELEVKGPYRDRHLSIGFGSQWKEMNYWENGLDISSFAEDNGMGIWPYPVLGWSTFVGFITETGGVFAINDTYQVYMRAKDPFVLMDWALFRRPNTPGIEEGPLERKYIPLDYRHLVWNRGLAYHLPRYRAFALTEAGRTEYLLEGDDKSPLCEVRVTELKEVGSDLFVTYHRGDRQMDHALATDLIVFKLLDEFFEGSFRSRIQLIHLKDDRDGKAVTLTWPKTPQR